MPSRIHRWILSLTVASIVILAGCAVTAQRPPATPPPPVSDNATTPDAVVRDLYTYWTTFQGSPLAAQDAGRTPYFTETFLRQLDEQFATADGPILDPIVCALNTPERFVLESVTVDDTTATAIVQTYWAGGTEVREVRLRLLQTDQGWKVAGTDCQWPLSEDTTPPPDTPPGSTLPLTTPPPSETQSPDEIEIVLYWFVGEELQPEYRRIPHTLAVGTAVLELLLAGPPPGLSTAIPTPDEVQAYAGRHADWGPRVRLLGLTIEDGVATANFSEEMHAYGGGSARVAGIREQITRTLQQFPTVNEVQIAIEGQTEGVLQP